MEYQTKLTERERGIWRAALTLAHNLCVQKSDRVNSDDGSLEAVYMASDCATAIKGWLEPDDRQLAEMLTEAGVQCNAQDRLCERLQSIVSKIESRHQISLEKATGGWHRAYRAEIDFLDSADVSELFAIFNDVSANAQVQPTPKRSVGGRLEPLVGPENTDGL